MASSYSVLDSVRQTRVLRHVLGDPEGLSTTTAAFAISVAGATLSLDLDRYTTWTIADRVV